MCIRDRLDEMRKVEALAVAEAEHAKPDGIGSLERVLDRAEPVEGLQEAPNEDLTEPTAPVLEVIPAEDEDWFGMKDGDTE